MTDQPHSILSKQRRAGVGIHLSSLPGRYGIGDMGDSAHEFITLMTKMRLGVWQFLPTGPTAYGDSPYQPLSAFAGNELLIGIEPLIRLGLLGSDEAEDLAALPRHSVDYGKLIPKKRQLLMAVADRFSARADAKMRVQYEEFQHQTGSQWLDDYGLYRFLKSKHGERPWTEWDRTFVHRDQAAMERVRDSARTEIEQIRIIQFLFDLQWRQMHRFAADNGILLFGDMPIYIALDSADAWAHKEILHVDREGTPSHVSGVPPDYFSEDGQLWGNPLYDWKYHAANGYQWWIERMRHSAHMADMVRIDHFRGFESFWSVPVESDTARNGTWEPGPGDALFEAMQNGLGNLPIVAEDLGVITPEVDALRHRHRIPGMKVLQFEVDDEEFSLAEVKENCVCYTGTHDNDTTVGWFIGGNNDTRTPAEILQTQRNALRLTGGTAATIHADMIRYAFSSRARLAIAPMQDFLGLGSQARLNIPGTTTNNWRWRWLAEQQTPALTDLVGELVSESSRA
jgi:4-alpha-glucanotransferase